MNDETQQTDAGRLEKEEIAISSFSSRPASVCCVSSFICFPPAFSVSIPQPVPGYADPLQQKSGNIS